MEHNNKNINQEHPGIISVWRLLFLFAELASAVFLKKEDFPLLLCVENSLA